MKRIIIAALALVAAVACGPKTQPLDPEVVVGPYTITNFTQNVYHIQDYNDQNPAGEEFDAEGNKTHFNNCSDMYLVVGENEALLIDLSNYIRWADNAVESLQSLVAERIGDKPLTITFTHNHGDHTGMLPAFIENKDVKFSLPRIDFEKMVARFPGINYELYDDLKKYDLGGITLTAVLVPGHTAGSMVFFLDGQDILFTGDAVGSGHGIWLYDVETFKNYVGGFKHLMEYINNPANGINKEALRLYGGHYWQKDWFPELGDDTFAMQYLYDMEKLIAQIIDGSAYTEPSNLDHRVIDTYFRNGQAIIAWNAECWAQYRAENE